MVCYYVVLSFGTFCTRSESFSLTILPFVPPFRTTPSVKIGPSSWKNH
jgi:hypothetical protein